MRRCDASQRRSLTSHRKLRDAPTSLATARNGLGSQSVRKRWISDASAQSVEQVARLSRNVRQPNRVLANGIGGNKAERRPRAGKEWLAATKHDGVEVESILINKTKVG
jgi:hypothetical protein